ncbi:conserved hypothetical protein [Theileria orientalis strain Shintoku]|uniref:Cleavage stimulation factor subunit 2 hinge domain-containing protein n=1 Tax=Theileria orientalis strain Shintoku TaxID=869250 RepID=J4CDZ2_THEOR|nr:conserved hypothetical protein [Theileria orientalis strain Shintoku]BAM41987.1 conserved hypothetical protein [Theileria orientalis strain Shintoku]|eukprot:XP_009692288.1 conserved hypothetical protein [Theileria orientalis strain Shintoku]
MNNFNPNIHFPPPPPPPPMKPMDMEQQHVMVQSMVDSYDDDMLKMAPPNFVPQPPPGPPQAMGIPPPPPGPMVHGHPVNAQHTMVMGGMMPHMNMHPVPSRHLIDPYLAAEISSIVHTLSTSQLIYVLASLKKFLKHAPSEARRFLLNNPQLTYALLHTQFILGGHDETILPLSRMDHEISQVNKMERSMHLKPFHNLYEEATGPVDQRQSYSTTQIYGTSEQVVNQQLTPEMPKYEQNMYQEEAYYPQQQQVAKGQGASQAEIEELMNQGIYPASAALVDEVIKNPEILTNIQKATRQEMTSWPEEQKQQVLSIKIVRNVVDIDTQALHMRGISVNL